MTSNTINPDGSPQYGNGSKNLQSWNLKTLSNFDEGPYGSTKCSNELNCEDDTCGDDDIEDEAVEDEGQHDE